MLLIFPSFYDKIVLSLEPLRESCFSFVGNLTVSRANFANGKIHRLLFVPLRSGGMEIKMRIDNDFFTLNALEAAPALVGKLICLKKTDGEVLKMRITETEAYLGESDTACHASRGKTDRNSALWLKGGHTYVYLCYGMYNMFNVVTGAEGDPQGVLIRGVEGYLGPGKFTKHCGIDKSYNKIDMRFSDDIWIEDDGAKPDLVLSPRVGIDYADEKDRTALYRFTDKRFAREILSKK